VIYGYHMFVEQALGQFKAWFGDRFDCAKARMIMEEKALECLGIAVRDLK
jgi:shikimate 5-dehydrogenase